MPKDCFEKVFEECGGVLMAESCESVPRNKKKQVANIKSTSAMSSGECDSLYAIIDPVCTRCTRCNVCASYRWSVA